MTHGRLIDLGVAALSVGAATWSIAMADDDALIPATCIVVAILWGVVPFVIDTLLASAAPEATATAATPATLTTIVCIGDEPKEVARRALRSRPRSAP